jgi:hypothetical protein
VPKDNKSKSLSMALRVTTSGTLLIYHISPFDVVTGSANICVLGSGDVSMSHEEALIVK